MINKYETPMCHLENKTQSYTSTLIIYSNITRVPKKKKSPWIEEEDWIGIFD